jgi:alkylation response protein AidB-like acyl-CoA dehydrogenase
MDLRYTAEEAAFRKEVRAFFDTAIPEATRQKVMLGQRVTRDEIIAWQRIVNKKGWVAPLWPVEHGGTGWDVVKFFIFREEMNRAYAPELLSMNINLVGPVVLAFGTDKQKAFFLPKLRNADVWFCQGFSEPGSGSDLASLKTRAVREGDHYVVNGQKIWTSNGHRADWMFALVRTDPGAKKQSGITYLLLDMKTPGITVRPIVTLDGTHHLNEVFFDDVKVPVENRIGEENKGWTYAKFLLGNERANVARVGVSKSRMAYAKMIAAQTMVEGRPLLEVPRFREKMAQIEVELKALEMTNLMVVSTMKKAGSKTQDPRTSVLKLKGSEILQNITELLFEIAGPEALAYESEFLSGQPDTAFVSKWNGAAARNYFQMRAASIYGGTNEIQHNVVAKGVLGL